MYVSVAGGLITAMWRHPTSLSCVRTQLKSYLLRNLDSLNSIIYYIYLSADKILYHEVVNLQKPPQASTWRKSFTKHLYWRHFEWRLFTVTANDDFTGNERVIQSLKLLSQFWEFVNYLFYLFINSATINLAPLLRPALQSSKQKFIINSRPPSRMHKFTRTVFCFIDRLVSWVKTIPGKSSCCCQWCGLLCSSAALANLLWPGLSQIRNKVLRKTRPTTSVTKWPRFCLQTNRTRASTEFFPPPKRKRRQNMSINSLFERGHLGLSAW